MAEMPGAGRREGRACREVQGPRGITANPPTSARAAARCPPSHRPSGSPSDPSLGPKGSLVESRYSAKVQPPNTRSKPSSARMPRPGRRARSPRGNAEPSPCADWAGGARSWTGGAGPSQSPALYRLQAPPPPVTARSALNTSSAAPVTELGDLGVSREPATPSLQHTGQSCPQSVTQSKCSQQM